MDVPATPADSPLTLADVRVSERYRALSTPRLAAGEPAVPFALPLLERESGRLGAVVDVAADFGRMPVALVFGSYT